MTTLQKMTIIPKQIDIYKRDAKRVKLRNSAVNVRA